MFPLLMLLVVFVCSYLTISNLLQCYYIFLSSCHNFQTSHSSFKSVIFIFILCLTAFIYGRAIAQAVSRWLPTAAVQGSRQGHHVGFCGGQSGAGAGFLQVLRFPLPNSFHQLLQKIIIIIIIIINQSIMGDMYNRPNGQTSMAAVQGPNRHLRT
jgi:hypothetical protein